MNTAIYNTLSFLIEFIKLYIGVGFITKLTVKNKKISSVLFAVTVFIILTVSAFFDISKIGIIYGIISVLLIFFSVNEKKKTGLVVFIYICICMTDMVISFLCVRLVPSLTYDYIYQHREIEISINSILMFVLFIVFCVKHHSFNKGFIERLSLPYIVLFVVSGILLSLYMTYFQLFQSNDGDHVYEVFFNAINIISIFFVFVCIVFSFLKNKNEKQKYEIDMMKEYIKLKEDYYRTIAEKDEEIRKFRHDIKNHMYCIHTLLNNGEYSEVNEYIDRLDDKLSEASLRFNTGNVLINAILNDCSERFKDVSVELNGVFPAIFSLSSIDICTVFSNVLSNAFEAADKSEEKTVTINMGIMNGNVVFIVKNSSDTAPKIEKRKFITSKSGSGHGYGTENIKNCIEKNNGLLQYSYIDRIFAVKIVFFNTV